MRLGIKEAEKSIEVRESSVCGLLISVLVVLALVVFFVGYYIFGWEIEESNMSVEMVLISFVFYFGFAFYSLWEKWYRDVPVLRIDEKGMSVYGVGLVEWSKVERLEVERVGLGKEVYFKFMFFRKMRNHCALRVTAFGYDGEELKSVLMDEYDYDIDGAEKGIIEVCKRLENNKLVSLETQNFASLHPAASD